MLNVILAALIIGLVFAILSAASDVMIGYGGLIIVNQGAIMALGAYGAAIAAVDLGFPPIAAIVVGTALAAVIGTLTTWPAFRLEHEYFLVASLAAQIAIIGVINNWTGLTRGSLGFHGIERPALFEELSGYFGLTAVAAMAVLGILWWLLRGDFGLSLRALREDQVSLEGLGLPTRRLKAEAMLLSSGLMGLGGAVYAFFVTSIDPASFTFDVSVLVLAMVVIGGAGNFWGTFLAGVLLIGIPEALRFVGVATLDFAQFRQIAYGLLMILFVMYRPSGLWGRYAL